MSDKKRLEQNSVSVIIPVHNDEKNMTKCIESVLKPSNMRYIKEVIIIDNNSTDKTKKILNQYSTHKKVTILFEKKVSRGAARKKGELSANAKYIAMTDSDCIVPNDWIKTFLEQVHTKNISIIQGSETNVIKSSFQKWYAQKYFRTKDMHSDKIRENFIGQLDTKNLFIKRKLLETINYSNSYCVSGNDIDVSMKLTLIKEKVLFIKNPVTHKIPTLKTFLHKQIYRAYWIARITRMYETKLNLIQFKKQTKQSLSKATIYFLDIFTWPFTTNPSNSLFNTLQGIYWSYGILLARIKK